MTKFNVGDIVKTEYGAGKIDKIEWVRNHALYIIKGKVYNEYELTEFTYRYTTIPTIH